MYEAAAIVNCRPLTIDNLNDPTSLEPITPNHLLTMKSKIVLPPPGEFQRADLYSRKRWRRVQHLINEFWTRWKNEYLQNLQVRQKWSRPCRNLCVGDIVIIKNDNVPRNQWNLAKVIKVFPGKDGRVRKVKLATSDTELERPVQKLVLLLRNKENSPSGSY